MSALKNVLKMSVGVGFALSTACGERQGAFEARSDKSRRVAPSQVSLAPTATGAGRQGQTQGDKDVQEIIRQMAGDLKILIEKSVDQKVRDWQEAEAKRRAGEAPLARVPGAPQGVAPQKGGQPEPRVGDTITPRTEAIPQGGADGARRDTVAAGAADEKEDAGLLSHEAALKLLGATKAEGQTGLVTALKGLKATKKLFSDGPDGKEYSVALELKIKAERPIQTETGGKGEEKVKEELDFFAPADGTNGQAFEKLKVSDVLSDYKIRKMSGAVFADGQKQIVSDNFPVKAYISCIPQFYSETEKRGADCNQVAVFISLQGKEKQTDSQLSEITIVTILEVQSQQEALALGKSLEMKIVATTMGCALKGLDNSLNLVEREDCVGSAQVTGKQVETAAKAETTALTEEQVYRQMNEREIHLLKQRGSFKAPMDTVTEGRVSTEDESPANQRALQESGPF